MQKETGHPLRYSLYQNWCPVMIAVGGADKTDPVVDILKEYVPEEKFAHAADTLCVCIENTKYAVFEQGFLRGIAAEKGGNI